MVLKRFERFMALLLAVLLALSLFNLQASAATAPSERDVQPRDEDGYLSLHQYVSPTDKKDVYKVNLYLSVELQEPIMDVVYVVDNSIEVADEWNDIIEGLKASAEILLTDQNPQSTNGAGRIRLAIVFFNGEATVLGQTVAAVPGTSPLEAAYYVADRPGANVGPATIESPLSTNKYARNNYTQLIADLDDAKDPTSDYNPKNPANAPTSKPEFDQRYTAKGLGLAYDYLTWQEQEYQDAYAPTGLGDDNPYFNDRSLIFLVSGGGDYLNRFDANGFATDAVTGLALTGGDEATIIQEGAMRREAILVAKALKSNRKTYPNYTNAFTTYVTSARIGMPLNGYTSLVGGTLPANGDRIIPNNYDLTTHQVRSSSETLTPANYSTLLGVTTSKSARNSATFSAAFDATGYRVTSNGKRFDPKFGAGTGTRASGDWDTPDVDGVGVLIKETDIAMTGEKGVYHSISEYGGMSTEIRTLGIDFADKPTAVAANQGGASGTDGKDEDDSREQAGKYLTAVKGGINAGNWGFSSYDDAHYEISTNQAIADTGGPSQTNTNRINETTNSKASGIVNAAAADAARGERDYGTLLAEGFSLTFKNRLPHVSGVLDSGGGVPSSLPNMATPIGYSLELARGNGSWTGPNQPGGVGTTWFLDWTWGSTLTSWTIGTHQVGVNWGSITTPNLDNSGYWDRIEGLPTIRPYITGATTSILTNGPGFDVDAIDPHDAANNSPWIGTPYVASGTGLPFFVATDSSAGYSNNIFPVAPVNDVWAHRVVTMPTNGSFTGAANNIDYLKYAINQPPETDTLTGWNSVMNRGISLAATGPNLAWSNNSTTGYGGIGNYNTSGTESQYGTGAAPGNFGDPWILGMGTNAASHVSSTPLDDDFSYPTAEQKGTAAENMVNGVRGKHDDWVSEYLMVLSGDYKFTTGNIPGLDSIDTNDSTDNNWRDEWHTWGSRIATPSISSGPATKLGFYGYNTFQYTNGYQYDVRVVSDAATGGSGGSATTPPNTSWPLVVGPSTTGNTNFAANAYRAYTEDLQYTYSKKEWNYFEQIGATLKMDGYSKAVLDFEKNTVNTAPTMDDGLSDYPLSYRYASMMSPGNVVNTKNKASERQIIYQLKKYAYEVYRTADKAQVGVQLTNNFKIVGYPGKPLVRVDFPGNEGFYPAGPHIPEEYLDGVGSATAKAGGKNITWNLNAVYVSEVYMLEFYVEMINSHKLDKDKYYSLVDFSYCDINIRSLFQTGGRLPDPYNYGGRYVTYKTIKDFVQVYITGSGEVQQEDEPFVDIVDNEKTYEIVPFVVPLMLDPNAKAPLKIAAEKIDEGTTTHLLIE